MMYALFRRIFYDRWQRKLMALIIAIVAWALMHQAITVTKTINNIPVKVINLPPGKTIDGLLPTGYLDHNLTLTIVGSRSALEKLTAADLEVLVDAEGKGDEWIVHAGKGSLVSKNPSLDVKRSIKDVIQNEFIISLTPLVTEQVPVIILKPIGTPPPGYQFLDVWPQFLTQTITGPENEVQKLKVKGIKLVLDLDLISEKDLDKLAASDPDNQEEISFYVPESWKTISIPFLKNTEVPLNDADSSSLRINFLKRSYLSLDTYLPIALYFPANTLSTWNPDNSHIALSERVKSAQGLFFLNEPLYVKDVSSLFLDVIRDYLQLNIVVSGKDYLQWSIDLVDVKNLEKAYITMALAENPDKLEKELPPHLKEDYLRSRFRTYVDQFRLFTSQKQPFVLHPVLQDAEVLVK